MTIFYHSKRFSTVNRGVNSYEAGRKNCVEFEAIHSDLGKLGTPRVPKDKEGSAKGNDRKEHSRKQD